MPGEIVARSYALALFELADRDGRMEEFGDGLRGVAALLDESREARLFLETPRIQREEKKRVLRKALEGKLRAPVLNFLFLVIDKRRQRLIRVMNREYQLLVDDRLGRAHVEVSLAREPDASLRAGIEERLTRFFGKKVIPHVRVIPALMGGIVFRSGDTVYDGSVLRRMGQLRRRLVAAEVSLD